MRTTLAPKIFQPSLLQFLPPSQPRWTIDRVPAGVALGSDRWWLCSGDWHYCLQLTGKEADRLAAWLKHLDLDFSIDERGDGAPNCAGELHDLIAWLIDCAPALYDREGAA